jgi:hypothetical protein
MIQAGSLRLLVATLTVRESIIRTLTHRLGNAKLKRLKDA